MCEVIVGIPEFYREVIAPVEVRIEEGNSIKKISALSRMEFLFGSLIAIGFLVQKVVLSIFFFLANVFTCGLSQSFRASFCKNIQAGLKYFGAIPLGWAGVLIPHVINRKILRIPVDGLFVQS